MANLRKIVSKGLFTLGTVGIISFGVMGINDVSPTIDKKYSLVWEYSDIERQIKGVRDGQSLPAIKYGDYLEEKKENIAGTPNFAQLKGEYETNKENFYLYTGGNVS